MTTPAADAHRFERKFFIHRTPVAVIENTVRLNRARFSEIFHSRHVNNIYLDTPSLNYFSANVIGLSRRVKVRIRWYGGLLGTVDNPVLEFKIKNNIGGLKQSYVLPPFVLDERFDVDSLERLFAQSVLPDKVRAGLAGLGPALVNRYRRTYYLSADRDFRITVDQQLEYTEVRHRFNTFSRCVTVDNARVLELKYALDKDDAARAITQGLPFRLTRSSKYVSGLLALSR